MSKSNQKDFAAVERAFQACTPIAPEINRDTLMYRAGWAAAEQKLTLKPTSKLWQGMAVLSTAAAVLMAARLGTLPTQPNEQLATPSTVAGETELHGWTVIPFDHDSSAFVLDQSNKFPGTSASATAEQDYLSLRSLVLQRGVEALPESVVVGAEASASTPVSTARSLREEFLKQSSLQESIHSSSDAARTGDLQGSIA